jgi:hypothetical protein
VVTSGLLDVGLERVVVVVPPHTAPLDNPHPVFIQQLNSSSGSSAAGTALLHFATLCDAGDPDAGARCLHAAVGALTTLPPPPSPPPASPPPTPTPAASQSGAASEVVAVAAPAVEVGAAVAASAAPGPVPGPGPAHDATQATPEAPPGAPVVPGSHEGGPKAPSPEEGGNKPQESEAAAGDQASTGPVDPRPVRLWAAYYMQVWAAVCVYCACVLLLVVV